MISLSTQIFVKSTATLDYSKTTQDSSFLQTYNLLYNTHTT